MTRQTELQPTFEVLWDAKNPASFDEVFLEAADSVFSLLGNSSKQAIYHQLESHYGLNKAEIPHKIAEFAAALEKLFGKASLMLEAKIIAALHTKVESFKCYPKKDGLLFVAYAEGLRRFMCA